MTLYPLIVFVHVVAATALVASSLVAPFARVAMLAARDLRSLASAMGTANRIEAVAPIVALITLGTGVYLGVQGWLQAAWFWGALSLFILNVVLVAAAIAPSRSALEAAVKAAGAGPIPAGIDALRTARMPAVAANLMLAGDIAMLYLMTAKPAFTGTLAASGVALGAVIATSLLRRRRTPQPLDLIEQSYANRIEVAAVAVAAEPSSERITVPA